MTAVTPVILCGGSGTRLWPLSRASYPKQFVPLFSDGENGELSLIESTLRRVAGLNKSVLCVGNEEHRFLVHAAMESSGVTGRQFLEPEGRNTAPAMACIALTSVPDELLLFLPADHYVPDADKFCETIRLGISAAQQGAIVTYGIQPTSPHTGYGYIRAGRPEQGGLREVAAFTEKPNRNDAEHMCASGDYLWNAGIFLTTARTLLNALAAHAPDILEACKAATAEMTDDGPFFRPDRDAFLACRSESIDYAVIEKHDRLVVVPFEGAWSDVGSWNAVAELTQADENGNRISGFGHSLTSKNTYINAPHRPVVALGTSNLLIIDTPDAVLVADKGSVEQVRQVVAALEKQGASQAVTHRRVDRPWGWYDSLEVGSTFQVKRIVVKPGGQLSLQLHRHRSEHWVVVHGTARVTNGERVFDLHANESTYIPVGTRHRLENITDDALEIIEVQSGDYLGEDDIVRFEDTYGRTES